MTKVNRNPEKLEGTPYAGIGYILDSLCESEDLREVPSEQRAWRWTVACFAKVARHERPADLLIEDGQKNPV